MRRTIAAALLGLVGACFDAPNGAVMFSCDPENAPECPSGYTCESDGCCHRDGSDVDANLGGCKLAPGTEATTLTTATTESGSGSSETASSETGSSGSDSTGSGSTGSGSSSSESTAGESSSSVGEGPSTSSDSSTTGVAESSSSSSSGG
jgi:hypothetical protein